MRILEIFRYCIVIQTILSSISTQSSSNTPKLCIHCIHFKKNILSINKFGKCKLFPIQESYNYDYLIDGIKRDNNIDYTYCSIARKYDRDCGKEGKFYEKNNNNFFINLNSTWKFLG